MNRPHERMDPAVPNLIPNSKPLSPERIRKALEEFVETGKLPEDRHLARVLFVALLMSEPDGQPRL